MPGEVSLAHNGVLFLDELPECRRHVLEVFRKSPDGGILTAGRGCHAPHVLTVWRAEVTGL